MNNKQFGIIIFSASFGVTFLIWGILWMVMCLDYKNQVGRLEQEIIGYKWQLEQVPYICNNN